MTDPSAPKPETDFTKLFATLRLPLMPDLGALMAAQQRNVEALTQAYRVTLEGGQQVARQHMDIMRQTLTELSETLQGLPSPETSQGRAATQAELVKKANERAITNMRMLSETMQHANEEAVSVLNRRFVAAVDELKALAEEYKPK